VPSEELPPPIRAFISRYVRSVEHLEILLLFTPPDRSWSVAAAYDKIMSTPQSVERALEEFAQNGLLQRATEPPHDYRSVPDQEVQEQVAALAQLYRLKPVRVIEAIYHREAGAAQSFADAFKIKPDPSS
jgi:hypothetical protein